MNNKECKVRPEIVNANSDEVYMNAKSVFQIIYFTNEKSKDILEGLQ